MEIYAAKKLSKYMTALGAYNVRSFTYKIKLTHARVHTYTHIHITHTQARACALTHARAHTNKN